MKEKQKLESNINKLELNSAKLKKEVRRYQDEVEKALKIHQVNEKLQ